MSRSLFVIAAISKSGFSALAEPLAATAPTDRPMFLYREISAMACEPIPLVASYHAVLEPWHGIGKLISLYGDDAHPMMGLMHELESNGYVFWTSEQVQHPASVHPLFSRLKPDDPGYPCVQILDRALQDLNRFTQSGTVCLVATLCVGPSFDDGEFK